MDGALAEAFAEILDEVWSKPWLGNATTEELLDELQVRVIEVPRGRRPYLGEDLRSMHLAELRRDLLPSELAYRTVD